MSACRPVYAIRPFVFRRCRNVVSGDEDDKVKKLTTHKAKGERQNVSPAKAWRTKHTKKKKMTIEHKTYEEPV